MNNTYVLLLFLALFASSANAQTDTASNPYFQSDAATVVGSPGHFQRAKKAVFQARSADHPWIAGTCTATYISNEGHFITALHCLRQCIEKHDASPYILADVRASNGRLIDALVPVLADRLAGKTCTLLFGEDSPEEREAELIAYGPGFTYDTKGPIQWMIPMLKDTSNTANIQKVLTAVSSGLVGNLDFAILKIKDSPRTECLRFSQKSAADLDNLSVWSLSYPAKTDWKDENLADGKTRLVARGRLLPSYLNSTPVRSFAEELKTSGRLGEDRVDQKLDIIFNLYGTKVTTMPAMQGSSGATVLDETDASIVGVVSYIMAENETTERATFIMLGETIKSYVEEYFPETNPSELFKCSFDQGR